MNFRLTGAMRVRPIQYAFRQPTLTLQVEEEYDDGPDTGYGMEYLRGSRWRDARVEDLAHPAVAAKFGQKGTV